MEDKAQIEAASLMSKAQQGDEKAYRQCLKLILPWIQRYAKARIQVESAAEDCSQEALLKIHHYRHTFDPSQKFGPWMYTICRNLVADHYRKLKRQADRPGSSEFDMLTLAGSEDHAAEAKLSLESALKTLTPEQVEAIKLAKIDGLSFDDIAVRIGISKSAAKVRAHRAYKALKEALMKSH